MTMSKTFDENLNEALQRLAELWAAGLGPAILKVAQACILGIPKSAEK